jgi:hypothetical protein
MSCLVLSRVMILALFLIGNVLDKGPRLFSVSLEASRDVLLTICRACLFAEGDAVNYLSRIGLNIVYHQDPVDEINFKGFDWQLIFVTVFSSLASLRLSQGYLLWFLCPMPLFIYHQHQFLSNQSQVQQRLVLYYVILHLY